MKVKIVISGCLGRMGERIACLAFNASDIEVIAGIEKEDHPSIGEDLSEVLGKGRRGIEITSDFKQAISKSDVLIEFTSPKVTLKHIQVASGLGKKILIGTTGFDEQGIQEIKKTGSETAVLISPNMSIGVNVMFKIMPQLVKLLGEDYDIEIVELHHNKKKDAPSGTAKKIAEIICDARSNLKCTYGRQGLTGPRDKDELAIHALRLGDITGEHRIIFAGNDERIEFIHSAGSRDIFAEGVILGVRYIRDKKSGFYTMGDVLSQRLR
ncbi:MAG: 4-hydroxy-tetrahydrodipicolinate reductase [Candidatus Saelkia tenebricola]|nr:4-hydroxy-tetrahydrodipicolinate reductase [Candidatus Saelkia tenebricola]